MANSRSEILNRIRNALNNEDLLNSLTRCTPTVWVNGKHSSSLRGLQLTESHLQEARDRWNRLVPLLAHLFPGEAPQGRIASELVPLRMDVGLGAGTRAFIKKDSHLPVCASVKARGGLFEVFTRAEEIGLSSGLLTHGDNYRKLAEEPLQGLLREEEVAVGSTGNLGMSVGLAAAGLGMRATVHMSTDAKAWKKELLRSRGVTVVEHAGLYDKAVQEGRRLASENPRCHFVDDEASETLFLGYSAAAQELKDQLKDLNVEVSAEQPLIVYIPCGVGGAPGGICWGLKHCFGDAVHVFFAEPTHAPCVTLGLASGLHDAVCVQDIGIDGKTEADGLAVGRPSVLVCHMVDSLVAGTFTVDDVELFQQLSQLLTSGASFMEPSCCASLLGPSRLRVDPTVSHLLERGTHVFWATGGALVPDSEREALKQKGEEALKKIGVASKL